MSEVLRGRCNACDHVWIVAHLPMTVEKVARLGRRAACPMCAGTKVFIAATAGPLSPEASPETPVKMTREHE